jgi:hypothetical protein
MRNLQCDDRTQSLGILVLNLNLKRTAPVVPVPVHVPTPTYYGPEPGPESTNLDDTIFSDLWAGFSFSWKRAKFYVNPLILRVLVASQDYLFVPRDNRSMSRISI